MKATMLKIAGVKSEKEFYKKFPDEASFMKTHGKEFKKALLGEKIKKAQMGDTVYDEWMATQGSQKRNPINIGSVSDKINPYVQPLSDVFAGISMIGSQKQKVRQANQMAQLTDIQADAAESRDIDFNRMNDQLRVRPEDMLTPSYRAYGEGTNPLAKYGKEIPKAFLGINAGNVTNFMDQGGAGLVDSVSGMFTNNKYGPSAGSQIGKGIGAGIGTAFLGPLGGIAGGFVGKIAGDLFDKDAERIERFENIANKNRQRSQGQLFAQGIQQQNQSFMEQGGNLTNPQLITKFGEHTMRELLDPDRTMDTLRTGGNLRQNYMYPQDQYALGGEVKTEWGGIPKEVSYNPNLGPSMELEGNSHEKSDGHGNKGIGVRYGGTLVEAEPEPMQEINNELIIYGAKKISPWASNMIGDKDAKGTYKKYVKHLNDVEAKQYNYMEKGANLANEADNTSFGKLALSTAKAMQFGPKQKLDQIAKFKEIAAKTQELQNAMEETKQAKKGATIEKAQDGKGMLRAPLIYRNEPVPFNTEAMRQAYLRTLPQAPVVPVSKVESYVVPPVVPAVRTNPSASQSPSQATVTINDYLKNRNLNIPAPGDLSTLPKQELVDVGNYSPDMRDIPQERQREYPWIPIVNEAARWFRPRYRIEQPDLTAEMMAAGMNQLEPVQAQRYQPLLPGEPPSISMQDQLNEITAQTRQAQRNPAVAGNPAAQAIIAAQAYGPKSNVLANQFRTNQELREKYRMQNLETLNDAQLKNLGISDQQFVRQAQAKSNTKQAALEIAKSMSDKIARAKQEQTLADLERWRYNYVFGPNGVPINWNGIAQFNMEGAGPGTTRALPEGYEYIYDSKGRAIDVRKVPSSTTSRARSESRNGSIVRALKNL